MDKMVQITIDTYCGSYIIEDRKTGRELYRIGTWSITPLEELLSPSDFEEFITDNGIDFTVPESRLKKVRDKYA